MEVMIDKVKASMVVHMGVERPSVYMYRVPHVE